MPNVSRDDFLRDAFIYHMKRGKLSLLVGLVERGAPITATDESGNNVLHYSITQKNVDMASLFFEQAPHLMFEPNDQGVTPCRLAVQAALDDPTSGWMNLVVPDKALRRDIDMLAISPVLIGLYLNHHMSSQKRLSDHKRACIIAGMRTATAFLKAYRVRLLQREAQRGI